MIDGKRKPKRIQIVPFFTDHAVYKQALMLANASGVRLNEYIIQALSGYYQQEFKETMQFVTAAELHDCIVKIGKKRNRTPADAIEAVVKEFNERKFKE